MDSASPKTTYRYPARTVQLATLSLNDDSIGCPVSSLPNGPQLKTGKLILTSFYTLPEAGDFHSFGFNQDI